MAPNRLYTTDDTEDRGLSWFRISVLGAGAYYGGKWLLNQEFIGTNADLPYLTATFRGNEDIWPQLVGRKAGPLPGQFRYKYIDYALNAIKAAEESMFKIPRTFDLYATLFKAAYSGVKEGGPFPFVLTPEELKPFRPYYEALLDRKLTEDELRSGLAIGTYFEEGVPKAGLFKYPGSEEAYQQLLAGKLEGAQPILKNARIQPRVWKVTGDNILEGSEHLMRGAQTLQRMRGVEAVSASRSSVPMIVTGERGFINIPISSELGSIVGEQKFEVPELVERAFYGASKVGTSLSTRYMYLQDYPVELINETMFASRSEFLEKLANNPFYKGAIRNRFGTGGNYVGGVVDLWAKHAKKVLPLMALIGIGYTVADSFTRTATWPLSKSPAQIASYPIAGAQLAYTSMGEITGLNAYTRYQERVAPGSTSPLALVGAGLAGGITAMVGEYAYDAWQSKAAGEKWNWVRRNEKVTLPESLNALKKIPGIGKIFEGEMSRAGRAFKIGGLAGLALMIPMIPGMIGTTNTPQDLRGELSGDKLVPVRKGRWWELGRTAFEGNDIEAFRPGWFAELQNEYTDRAIYGDYYDKPLTRAMKSLVNPYWVEEMNYWDRPYPITGPKTSIMGPLGTLWDATVGQIIKPPVYMHEDEWRLDGRQTQVEKPIEAPAYGLGGLAPQEAESPYTLARQSTEFANKFVHAAGLPGFVISAAKEHLTGTHTFGSQEPVLASAANYPSLMSQYYGMSLGGGLTTTEALRRFIPNRSFEVQEVNPVANQMPSWMPSTGAVNFHMGDPYSTVKHGAYRMPGPAFEAMNPELRGMDYEDYPDIYKYQILSDIAPDARETERIRQQVVKQTGLGEVRARDLAVLEARREEKEERRRFAPTEGTGPLGAYYRTLVKVGRRNPLEYALPISPVHKFMGPTTAEEDYLENQVLSKEYGGWGTPIESFVKPTMNVMAWDAGFRFTPDEVEERRAIQQRFDALEYVKARRLEKAYQEAGQSWKASQWAARASRTFSGADPYAYPGEVERIFPSDQRAYFRAFKDMPVDRQLEMMGMVPAYQKPFYEAALENTNQAPEAPQGMLLENSQANQEFTGYLDAVAAGKRRRNTYGRYVGDARASKALMDSGTPSSDWVGWDPNVSLQDIKLKVVQNQGMDMHDFNMWESRALSLRRKPYINDVAVAQAMSGSVRNYNKPGRVQQLLYQHNAPPSSVVAGHASMQGGLALEVEYDNRKDTRRRMVKEGFLNG